MKKKGSMAHYQDANSQRTNRPLVLIVSIILLCLIAWLLRGCFHSDSEAEAHCTSSVSTEETAIDLHPLKPPSTLPMLPVDSETLKVMTDLASLSEASEDSDLIVEESSAPLPSWKQIHIRSGDTLGHVLIKNGVSLGEVHEILHASKESQHYLNHLYPDHVLSLKHWHDGQFSALKYHFDTSQYLCVYRGEDSRWRSEVHQRPIEIKQHHKVLTLTPSLFIAGKKAGLSDRFIMNLANLFAWDIDFARESYPSDTIKVLYETKEVDSDPLDDGQILAALYDGQQHRCLIVRFIDQSGHAHYLDDTGHSIKKSFLRTPVKFTRISSKFDLNRRHPVLHHIRAHKGVDYAAPTGTPVKASGDGIISFVGENGGYGNVVKIKHGERYQTVYAHLSKFAKKSKRGQHVKQGDIIGYVGSSGLATGPHLHYEFQVDGKHHDPLTVRLPHAYQVPESSRDQFNQQVLTQKNQFNAL